MTKCILPASRAELRMINRCRLMSMWERHVRQAMNGSLLAQRRYTSANWCMEYLLIAINT